MEPYSGMIRYAMFVPWLYAGMLLDDGIMLFQVNFTHSRFSLAAWYTLKVLG